MLGVILGGASWGRGQTKVGANQGGCEGDGGLFWDGGEAWEVDWDIGRFAGDFGGRDSRSKRFSDLNLKTEMAESESAAVIGPTRLPASRVA